MADTRARDDRKLEVEYKAERIEWIDANSPDNNMRWFTKKEAHDFFKSDVTKIITVGQVHAEDENYVMIISSFVTNDGTVDGLTRIPKVAILNRYELKCVRSQAKRKKL